LEQELARSKHELEDHLGVEITAISVPGGRWDERVADACAHAGYRYLFHSNAWAPPSTRHGLYLRGRHMVTGRMGPRELQKLVQATGVRRVFSRWKYEAKERVRLLVGDRVYHQIWCWAANWEPGEGVELEVDALLKDTRKSEHL
jgi:hypothetical protein